jgi:biopolymer transport protein ExbD
MTMAGILPLPVNSKKKTHAVKIDMTPMVDLGFLLITFFIFTTSLTQPTVTRLTMPQKHGTEEVYDKTLLTAILDKGRVIVYEGAFTKALQANKVAVTDYNLQSGLGRYIRQKQKDLQAVNMMEELLIAIKPLASASYQQVLTALDEMKINNVSRYGIMELSPEEKAYTKNR